MVQCHKYQVVLESGIYVKRLGTITYKREYVLCSTSMSVFPTNGIAISKLTGYGGGSVTSRVHSKAQEY